MTWSNVAKAIACENSEFAVTRTENVYMNLFIIPSWYPNDLTPLFGIFTKEQAMSIARLNPDYRVVVSTWGHEAGYIDVCSPRKAVRAISWLSRAKAGVKTDNQPLTEAFFPAASVSRRLSPTLHIARVFEANRQNLIQAIKRHGHVDLIHAHVSFPAGYIASRLSKQYKIPYIITEHMGPFPFPSLMVRGKPIPEITQAFGDASRTIAVSPALADAIASFGFKKPTVIPNLIDEEVFPYVNPPLPKPFKFFTLGTMTRHKGIDVLLDAIALWRPASDRVQFFIGGAGPDAKRFQAQCRRLRLDNLVVWLGSLARDEVPHHYQQTHAFVLPSRYETFGVVYAEAIATGRPVIASRCGGPESIVNTCNGILVDNGSAVSLAAALRAMYQSWQGYDLPAIRHDFLKRFSGRVVVNELRAVYEDVLSVA